MKIIPSYAYAGAPERFSNLARVRGLLALFNFGGSAPAPHTRTLVRREIGKKFIVNIKGGCKIGKRPLQR